MEQSISLTSERKNPWFNILLHTQSIVCARSMPMFRVLGIYNFCFSVKIFYKTPKIFYTEFLKNLPLRVASLSCNFRFRTSNSSRTDLWTRVSVSSLLTGLYSNFLGIIKDELLASKKRCLSSLESRLPRFLLRPSTSNCKDRRNWSRPEECIITAR